MGRPTLTATLDAVFTITPLRLRCAMATVVPLLVCICVGSDPVRAQAGAFTMIWGVVFFLWVNECCRRISDQVFDEMRAEWELEEAMREEGIRHILDRSSITAAGGRHHLGSIRDVKVFPVGDGLDERRRQAPLN